MRLVLAASIDTLAAWATLGTALGTALLAGATAYLAYTTRREVEAATDQAKASGRQVEQSARQAEAAERALLAQTRPLLGDVPFGWAERVTGYFYGGGSFLRGREPMHGDASQVTIDVLKREEARSAHLRVPFRNVGNGTAIIRSVEFIFSDDPGVSGVASTPVVAPGEFADATLDADGDSPHFGQIVAMDEGVRSFSVVLGYADADGALRGGTRFDVSARGEQRGWYVRQVFWAEDADAAKRSPAFGSQPRP